VDVRAKHLSWWLENTEKGKKLLKLRIMASVTIKVERDVMNNQRYCCLLTERGLFFAWRANLDGNGKNIEWQRENMTGKLQRENFFKK
jgi:hypothetical protein